MKEDNWEEELDELIGALIKDVHFERTYPAHTAYYQIDLNALKRKLRKVLTQVKAQAKKDLIKKIKKL